MRRIQAERKTLPHVPAGYRNNPFSYGPGAPRGAGPRVEVLSCQPGELRAGIDGGQRHFDISEDDRNWWIGNLIFPKVSRDPSAEIAGAHETASSPMPGEGL